MSAHATEQSDEQIVIRILSGEDLYEVLYLRYYIRVFRFAYSMISEQATAEDLAQETLAQVFQKLRTFRGESHFSTWLYKIARNHCLNYLRRARVTVESIEDVDQNRIHHLRAVDSPYDRVRQREIQYDVHRGLLSLSVHDREWIVLSDIVGLSYKELAEHFACPIGTVGSTLSRARDQLARKLDDLKGQI